MLKYLFDYLLLCIFVFKLIFVIGVFDLKKFSNLYIMLFEKRYNILSFIFKKDCFIVKFFSVLYIEIIIKLVFF